MSREKKGQAQLLLQAVKFDRASFQEHLDRSKADLARSRASTLKSAAKAGHPKKGRGK